MMAAPSPGTESQGLGNTQASPLSWTHQLDKQFENALAMYDMHVPDRWGSVAAMLPGKDPSEVKKHYDLLIEDINMIEAGRVPLPNYNKSSPHSNSEDDTPIPRKASTNLRSVQGYGVAANLNLGNSNSHKTAPTKAPDPDRSRKGIPWSEEEHRLFLLGLAKFGKGDWRSISRNFVISRTPTQVASHAQKYFIRLNSINNKDKRRSSIHDITSVSDGDSLPSSPSPITGMPAVGNTPWARSSSVQGGGMYEMGSHGELIGSPMLVSPTGHAHVPYGHVPVMSVSPMNMPHMSYSMAQSANA